MNIFFLSISVICLCIVLFRLIIQKRYVSITGKCVDIIRRERDLIPRTKCCYRYSYKGQSYEFWEKGYYYHIPKMKIGKVCDLFVEPNGADKCITPLDVAVNRDLIIVSFLMFLYTLINN